jgi:hypothetical protein
MNSGDQAAETVRNKVDGTGRDPAGLADNEPG